MTPDEQFVSTLEKLLERSKKNEVNWQRGSQSVFLVSFQGSPITHISIAFGSPEAAPDWFEAALYVGNEIAMALRVEEGGDTEQFDLLYELWKNAERSVVKWDQSLNVVNKALDSEEMVGAAPDTDDDIGF
ncbi:MAG: hypothetical protein HON53_17275 [Planctomycetaceae bacterium]|jgi:hypothetical protein|nr:hypothetical protein [Planctomycetaceae bacterium]MBT6153431.1 hypothetical protein [Planctomycetaceae bacterium]MBT6487300.1 hypothetical protein [Planctomycetaceae bacterium]MBT6493697.1 hypothetical protein [Planctomycetaceae bacterium]